MLESSENPLKLLEDDTDQVLDIIGHNNSECLKVFKYIVSSCNSTPINAGHNQQTSTKLQTTPSTQASANTMADSIMNYNNSIEKIRQSATRTLSMNEQQLDKAQMTVPQQRSVYGTGSINLGNPYKSDQ